MSATPSDLEMLKRQIAWIDVYVTELQHLEQPNRPKEYHERAYRIRNQSAPRFFSLVSSLLHDALIQGLANILDKPCTSGQDNLTLERIIRSRSDLMTRLDTIRSTPTYHDIKRARNKLLSHADLATATNYDAMTLLKDFPNLKPSQLEALVTEIREITAKMTGELPESFIVPDWKGVEVLFGLLER